MQCNAMQWAGFPELDLAWGDLSNMIGASMR